MSKFRVKRIKLYRNLFKRVRLFIIKEDTLEEKFSISLNLMNVFVAVTLSAIGIITLTTFIIAFTPLREYIPGYSSTKLKQSATALALKSDSLQVVVNQNNAYLEAVRKVLTGELELPMLSKDSISASTKADISKADLNPSEEELALRERIEKEDKYNLFEKEIPTQNLVLFSPARGVIAKEYSLKNRQFGLLINLATDKAVKSVANGTVVFAEWTIQNAYVVIIKHNEGLLSVYKRCASITKSQGDLVRTGEVIALGGETIISNKKSHLLFELWKDGYPINPTTLIDFKE